MRDNAQAVVNREGGTRLSMTEAVRRAVEALGYRAEVTQILDYVREQFGIDPSSADFAEGQAQTPEPVAPAETQPAPPAVTEASAEPVRKPASQPRPRPRNRTNTSD